MAVLGSRWAAPILWTLFWGEKRFFQILRELKGVSRRTLTVEIERLERLGLIQCVRSGSRAGVTYALSPLGRTLRPVLGGLYQWGLFALRLPEPVGEEEQARHRGPGTDD